MATRTLALCVLPLLACCFPVSAEDAPATLTRQLVASSQALVDAIPKGDKATWQRFLAEDAVLVDEFGRVTHKADTIASLHPFPEGFSGSIELRDPHATQHGNSATLQVEEYEQETVFGQKLTVRYQALLTYVKEGDDWKVVGYADVTLPTEPPKLVVNNVHAQDYVGTYRYAPTRAWTVVNKSGELSYTTRAGGTPNVLEPLGGDIFMGGDDERNLLIFRRGADGKVDALVERRKFNDLTLQRDGSRAP
jgi:ketosteroid isomerase-like protein